MKYRWTHAVCLTDFSRNQLLCLKTLATFPLSGDFRSRVRQPRNRWSFTDVQFWTCKYMGQNKFCRLCSFLTQISFFVIPIFCFSLCVFYFLNLKLEYLFEEIYTWVQVHFPEHWLVIKPQRKPFEKKFKGSLKHSFSVKAKLKMLNLLYSISS